MADLRESLLAAAATALAVTSVNWNSVTTAKPTGLVVSRHLSRQVAVDGLPELSVLYLGEADIESATNSVDRNIALGVRVRAKADSDESGDAALIPVMQWAEIALLNDYTLGGVAADGRLERIDAIDTQEYADVFAEALLSFVFTVRTKWGDPRQAP